MHRRLGRALEEIAGTFDLPLASVYAAMAYYYDHKDEIDQSLDEEEAWPKPSRRITPHACEKNYRLSHMADLIRFHSDEHLDPAKNQHSANGAK